MAATAGALGVTLAKPGAYSLGHGREPDVGDIARAPSAVAGQRHRLVIAVILIITISCVT